jgi:hypothetical protein
LNDKAQTLSYEHYYPYGGTALIAGKDKTQVLIVRLNHTADSIALVIIDRVLCGVAFVCFGEPVKGVIVMPI